MIVWLIVALPAVTLGLVLLNAFAWPRGRRSSLDGRTLSVLIPARDEAARIEACVRAALAAEGVREVIVYDDMSTDDTAAIVESMRQADDRVHLVSGSALPRGWVGKAHGCHRLSQIANGDAWLFVDADTILAPDAPARILDLFDRYGADVVTAVPRQETGTWAERLFMPMLHVTYAAWLPMPLVWLSRDPRFLAANGQVLAVTRAAFEDVGGFAAVRDAVVEDMAFCRRAKERGRRVVFADGHDIASCRMYDGAEEIWRGFSKNLYLGVGATPLALFTVVALYFATFVAPYLLWPWLGTAAVVAIAANVVMRTVLALRHRHHPLAIVFHPIAALAVIAIAFNSWRWATGAGVRWRGRTYEVKDAIP